MNNFSPAGDGNRIHDHNLSLLAKDVNIKNKYIISWYLYDLASSALLFHVYSYFQDWFLIRLGAHPFTYACSIGVAMLITLLMSPWLGRKLKSRGALFVSLTVLIVITAIAYTSIELFRQLLYTPIISIVISAGLLSLTVTCYSMSLVPYNGILGRVVSDQDRERVSGRGIAFGYVGQLCGAAVSWLISSHIVQYVVPLEAADIPVFALFGSAFFVLSLPLLIVSRRMTEFDSFAVQSPNKGGDYGEPKADNFALKALVMLSLFFLLYTVSSLGLFAPYYIEVAFGISGGTKTMILIVGIISAAIAGASFGKLTKKLSGISLQFYLCIGWLILSLVILSGVSNLPLILLGSIAFGVLLSATWANSRLVVIDAYGSQSLTFGLGVYNSVLGAATILGPVLWSIIFEFSHGITASKVSKTMWIPVTGSAASILLTYCVWRYKRRNHQHMLLG